MRAGKFSWDKDTATGLHYHTKVQRGGKAAASCLGWVSSAVFSRDGESVAFLYRVGRCASERHPRLSFLYTIDIDGKHLWRCAPARQTQLSDAMWGGCSRCRG